MVVLQNFMWPRIAGCRQGDGGAGGDAQKRSPTVEVAGDMSGSHLVAQARIPVAAPCSFVTQQLARLHAVSWGLMWICPCPTSSKRPCHDSQATDQNKATLHEGWKASNQYISRLCHGDKICFCHIMLLQPRPPAGIQSSQLRD